MLADVHALQAFQKSFLASGDFNVASDARIASQKGAVSGLATLDINGKIPAVQLTNGALEYQGTWNASSNAPGLASGLGTLGNFYIVSTAGSTTIDGNSTWAAGDWILFNGTIWQRVLNSVPPMTWYHTDATSTSSTSSNADVQLITITPLIAGIYEVTFEAQGSVSAAATITWSIYNNGVQRGNTIRAAVLAGAGRFTMNVKDIFTWSSGPITVYINTTAGTVTSVGRSLTLLKVA
jgi:hypothetical protein